MEDQQNIALLVAELRRLTEATNQNNQNIQILIDALGVQARDQNLRNDLLITAFGGEVVFLRMLHRIQSISVALF